MFCFSFFIHKVFIRRIKTVVVKVNKVQQIDISVHFKELLIQSAFRFSINPIEVSSSHVPINKATKI